MKYADAVLAVNGSKSVIKYKDVTTHKIGGVSFEEIFPGESAVGKVIYLGFPLETIYHNP